jgi:ubiquinone/menaquinone biosynthesis C-methylase UbiE
MIDKARENAEKMGFNNVEFRYGDIEKIPVTANRADVVVSNCVLNLVPDKEKAFAEIFRVLKPGGHFSISDVVLSGKLPEKIQHAAEMYAGCVSGAASMQDYLEIIQKAGFSEITIKKEKPIQIPEDILANYLTDEEISQYLQNPDTIKSITVFGRKPDACTETGCC